MASTVAEVKEYRRKRMRTLHEAQATWLLTASLSERRTSVPGLRGGRLVVEAGTFELVRYSLVPGVRLSGRVAVREAGPPLTFAGHLAIGGPGATPGTAVVSGSRLRG